MAKVENAAMLIGEQIVNNNQEKCRKVRVSARLRFAIEELGTAFKVRITLIGTDNASVDSDDGRSSFGWLPFRRNWETPIGDFDFSGGNGELSTSSLSLFGSIVYEKTLIPTTTEVDFLEERPCPHSPNRIHLKVEKIINFTFKRYPNEKKQFYRGANRNDFAQS
ncbi:hypothetical protein, partial [Runella aurantiaca]